MCFILAVIVCKFIRVYECDNAHSIASSFPLFHQIGAFYATNIIHRMNFILEVGGFFWIFVDSFNFFHQLANQMVRKHFECFLWSLCISIKINSINTCCVVFYMPLEQRTLFLHSQSCMCTFMDPLLFYFHFVAIFCRLTKICVYLGTKASSRESGEVHTFMHSAILLDKTLTRVHETVYFEHIW